MDVSSAATPEPPESAHEAEMHYSAFISYAHVDKAIAERLQSKLEGYKLPRRIAEQVGYRRIKPVFVDRSELRAAPNLYDEISRALEQSEFLIVVCTLNAPKSVWVAREIQLFSELRERENILYALFEGDETTCLRPMAPADEPGHPGDPLAADFRPEGDGKRLATLKLVASMVGVKLDDLVHRDAKRQRRHTIALACIIAAVVLTISGQLAYSYIMRERAVATQIAASRAMELQLGELREQIRRGGTLDMAAALNRSVELFYEEDTEGSGVPEVELGRAQLLHAKAQDDEMRGNYDAAAANAREAWIASSRVLSADPDNTMAIYVHAQSAFWVGFIAWRQRDTPLAAFAFDKYLELADRLVKADPDNGDWILEQAYANSNLGTLALREARNPLRAESYLNAAQGAFNRLAAQDPADLDIMYELADGEGWLSEAEAAQGDFAAAREHRRLQANYLDQMLAKEPDNLLFQVDYMSSQVGQARLDAAQKRYAASQEKLDQAEKLAERLVLTDPSNASLGLRKRAIELFSAENAIELASGNRGNLARAEELLGDCSKDWDSGPNDELPTYCNILRARVAAKRGEHAKVAEIMSDPRIQKIVRSPSLGAQLTLDLKSECRKVGDPKLCG